MGASLYGKGDLMSGNIVDVASMTVGWNVDKAQQDLMFAYGVREGDREKIKQLMGPEYLNVQVKATDEKGAPITDPDKLVDQVSLKGLQLIAEQRFQHSGRIFTLFSDLLSKIDQMKQRLIQKFGQG
jgi:hypothetical protein